MAKWRSKNKPNATGRNETSRFTRLDHRVLTSKAYRSLSPVARALLVELVMLYNGENNGSLYLSIRDAAARLGMADSTAIAAAFDDLQATGLLEMTESATFHVKASDKSRARCWRLRWLPGPGRKPPSWSFLEYDPEPKTRAHKRMERGMRALKNYGKARDSGKLPVLDSDTMTAFAPDPAPLAVLDSDTPKCENGSFQPIPIVPVSDTHIATMGVRGTLEGKAAA